MSGYEQLQPTNDSPAVAIPPVTQGVTQSSCRPGATPDDPRGVAAKSPDADDLNGLLHELSQPLGAINNYTAVCLYYLSEVQGPEAARVIEVVQRIAEQAARANEITRQLKSVVIGQSPELSEVDGDDQAEGVEH
jgi:hypothetical protein